MSKQRITGLSPTERSPLPVFTERFRGLFGENETQEEFANRVGLVRNTIGQYYNGYRIPEPITLRQICERCNVTSDWLLGLSDVKTHDADLQAVSKYIGLSEKAVNNIVYAKNEEHHETIRTLDALLSNDSACWNFYTSLNFMLLAYDSWVELANKGELTNHDRVIDENSWNEDFAFFKIYKHMEEATKNLIISDALEGIYQGEEL